MIRQIAIGLFAGAVAALVLAWARPAADPGRRPATWVAIGDPPRVLVPAGSSLSTSRPITLEELEPARLALEQRIDEVDWRGITFGQAIERLQARLRVNVYVRLRSLEAAGLSRDGWPDRRIDIHLSNITAGQLLQAILQQVGGREVRLGFETDENFVTVSLADQLARDTHMRVYDVRDLLAGPWPLVRHEIPDFTDRAPWATVASAPPTPDAQRRERAEELMRIIEDAVEPTNWRDNGGVTGRMYFFNGRLIIVQTPSGHRQIQAFIERLRAK